MVGSYIFTCPERTNKELNVSQILKSRYLEKCIIKNWIVFFVEQIKIRMKQLLLYQNSIFETTQYRKQIQNLPKFVKEKTLIFTY